MNTKGLPPLVSPTSAELAANESSLVVLTQAGKDAFSAFVVPDDAQTHPVGVLRVVNLSGHRIGMAIGDEIAELAARTSKLVPIVAGKKVFKLRLAHGGNGQWAEFWDQSLLFYPEVRSFAFIYDIPGIPNPGVKLRMERPLGFWKNSSSSP